MVRAIMDAFFTSNPRRQTDRHIPGRTWAGVSGQPAPSRICRICTAEHRPVSVCRIQRKTFLCSPHRSYTSSRLPAIPAFWCRIPDRIFRLPSRRTADISSFRQQALVPAFYCHSSAEFSGNTALSTRTVPSFSNCWSRSRLRCLLLCAHPIEILRVHAARLTCHVHAHKRHCRACTLIRRRRLHRGSLCTDKIAAALVGSINAALRCSSLIICSSSSLALTDETPKETISSPRKQRHFPDKTSFNASASSIV